MLELRGITKSYRSATLTQTALDSVDLAFRDNEFVAILGQSGSGKTTMLNIIGGLDHFDSGDLLIDSISTKDYKDRDWDAYRNNRIGFVFQSYNLISHQSVLENVELALTLSGVRKKERKKRALEALERVGLAEHVGKNPSQLSGGQMQRVAIARALVNDPEIVLADEPTGALDSHTSVQVMDLLREVAQDRLVIMVTHNPELAKHYATRIVELADGRIISDSAPFTPRVEDRREAQAARRTSMSPLTALSLSAKNLLTKKGRTLMTSFAGSIGIIGIAAILALANGVNAYIAQTEEDALTSYPLSITRSATDMSAMMEGERASDPTVSAQSGKVVARSGFAAMMNSRTTNDLASLKSYFDRNGGNISDYAATVEYTYDVMPRIYQRDTSLGIVQLNPDQAFTTLASASQVSPFSYAFQTSAFSQLPASESLYRDSYSVLAGHWPHDDHELVLVADSQGAISDILEYTLGLKDHGELDRLMADSYSGSGAKAPRASIENSQSGTRPYDYSDILGRTFSLVPASSLYTYDADHNAWIDQSGDTAFMKDTIARGRPLTIVGIVAPKDSSTTILRHGIAYTPGLTLEVMETAAHSPIVSSQLAHPDIDVFSAKSFAELESGQNSSGFDMSSLFSIDSSKIRSAFSIDPSQLQVDMSGLDMSSIDMSALNLKTIDMPNLDMSSLDPSVLASQIDLSEISASNLDFSALEKAFPKLAEVDYVNIIDTVLDSQVISADAGEKLSRTLSTLVEDFITYYEDNADTDGDGTPDADAVTLAARYMASPQVKAQLEEALSSGDIIDLELLTRKLGEALSQDPAIGQITEEISASFTQQVGSFLAEQMGKTLATQISQMLSTSLSGAMSSAMSQMMTQISSAITTQVSQAMSGFAQSIATAVSFDESAFAEAFHMNMDAQSLQKLLSTLMTRRPTTYETNLATLGYGKASEPSQIDIYPTTFADKDEVKAILDRYNTAASDAGDTGRVITYTDVVGLLMSSVTRIINIIKWMLIAFVSISLVVSSIMIAIITLISVLERKKEIGILRSIGASKRDVSHVFNAETFIIGLLAGLIGVGITLILALIANVIVEAQLDVHNIAQLPFGAGVILVAISVLLTYIAGVVPARKAAKEDPVEALRSE